ncbi:PREDICTED: histone H1-like [Nelumbo nucifera]|uniref:Histone H1-like n=1 Tax=Nelumbo nucifera TaxID=4432 RepID=A0A1U8BEA0_NELNU|nr:PREDICTED: histone H1-like [Nelumbo nucifera]
MDSSTATVPPATAGAEVSLPPPVDSSTVPSPPPPAPPATVETSVPLPAATDSTTAPVVIMEPHIAHAATAPPKQASSYHPSHPPYAEMIVSAIRGLNEKKGSSKKAIAKFIDAAYTNLPPTHSALLSTHLKRLKKSGHVVQVKHSYKLPKAAPSAPKKGRGRPPKSKLQIVQQPVPVVIGPDGVPILQKRGRGRPPKPKPLSAAANGHLLIRRGRGRPPKSKSKPFIVAGANGPVLAPKPRGPPKPRAPPKPRRVAVPGYQGPPRPRGRPRKILAVAPPVGAGSVVAPIVVKQGRPRGRPPKVVANNVDVGGAAGAVPVVSSGDLPAAGVASPAKRRGRPPKAASATPTPKRPVGRPRKVAAAQ